MLDEAINCYEKALELEDTDWEAHRDLGTCYMMRNDMEKAMKCFERAIEINPEDALSFNNIGSALIAMNKMR